MTHQPTTHSGFANSDDNINQELEIKLKETPDIIARCKLLFEHFINYRGRYDEYIKEQTEIILQEALTTDNKKACGDCYIILAWLKLDYDQYNDSNDLFNSALSYYTQINDKEGQIRALNGEASVYTSSGNFAYAFDRLLTVLELAREINNTTIITAITSNIGVTLADIRQFKEAVEYYKDALLLPNDSSTGKAITHLNIGEAYRELNEYQLAGEHFAEALKLSEEEQIGSIQSLYLHNMGVLRFLQGSIGEAKDYLNKALHLSEGIGVKRLKGGAFLYLGIIEESAGNNEDALTLLENALNIFREIKAESNIAQTLFILSKIYSRLGCYDKAYKASNEAQNIETRIFNEEIIHSMGIMKIQQARRENHLYKDLYNQITTISKIGQTITSTFNPEEIGNVVYHYIENLMEVDYLAVGLYSDDLKEITYKICIREGRTMPEFIHVIHDESELAAFATDTRTIISSKAAEGIKTILCPKLISGKDLNSFISSPLQIKGKNRGFLVVQSKKENAYRGHHLDIIKALAAYLAIALENERLFSDVNKLATTDPLTGQFNRRSVLESAQRLFTRYKRYGETFSVLMIDIDDFKSINDTYGHATGDQIIKVTTELLSHNIRSVDILGRMGGDEFIILLPNTKTSIGLPLLERLNTAIAQNIFKTYQEEELSIKISLGIAEVKPDDPDIISVIKRADEALYEVKKKKKENRKKKFIQTC